MSGSVNKVILVGRLGKDPEIRFTAEGTAVANFSLATDESFTDRAGDQQRRTQWHRVVVMWNLLTCQTVAARTSASLLGDRHRGETAVDLAPGQLVGLTVIRHMGNLNPKLACKSIPNSCGRRPARCIPVEE